MIYHELLAITQCMEQVSGREEYETQNSTYKIKVVTGSRPQCMPGEQMPSFVDLCEDDPDQDARSDKLHMGTVFDRKT